MRLKNQKEIEALDANDSAMPPDQTAIDRWETHVERVSKVIKTNVDFPENLTIEWWEHDQVWGIKYVRWGYTREYAGLIGPGIRNRRIEVAQSNKEYGWTTPISTLIKAARELEQLVDDDMLFIMRAIAAAEGDQK